jgi:lipopolysaccharide/colanic/teichoic acid biosynthesis glycosyltransferase
LIALIVKLSDGGPVFFRQQRIGQGGQLFGVLKFRSMVPDAEKLGLSITAEGDHRITRIGRFLRKHKLDELPQIWNVLVGDMSFVGPRPEVPRYVAQYTPEQRRILTLKPGITDLATLEFRGEEEMLRGKVEIGKAGSRNVVEGVEEFYLQYCVPRKIELSLAYAARANLWTDVLIILRTVFPCLERKHGPRTTDRDH